MIVMSRVGMNAAVELSERHGGTVKAAAADKLPQSADADDGRALSTALAAVSASASSSSSSSSPSDTDTECRPTAAAASSLHAVSVVVTSALSCLRCHRPVCCVSQ